MRGIMWGKISELSALYLWTKLLRLRGGGGGRKGGREAKSGGCVSAYGRVWWEEAWRRGIATSTGQTSDQYWLIFGGRRPSTTHREGAGKRLREKVGDYSPRKAR